MKIYKVCGNYLKGVQEFETKEEAKKFVIDKINKSIEKHQKLIDKSRSVLNSL